MYDCLVTVISIFHYLSLHTCNYGCGHTIVNVFLLVKKDAKYPFLMFSPMIYVYLVMACFHFLIPFFPLLHCSITAVLSNKCGFQLQYQMIFCVWLLAFSPQLCEQLRRYNVVPALSDILQESVKEKVTRIILAAYRVSGSFLVSFYIP